MKLWLVMIVKNEAAHIRETLESVRGVIDGVSILDTGSTDGTQDLIRTFIEDHRSSVFGAVHEEAVIPYLDTGVIDFAETRNRGLDLALHDHIVSSDAEDSSDECWMLLLNGDDVLAEAAPLRDFLVKARPSDEAFSIRIGGYIGGSFPSSRLVRVERGWRYVLPTHEVIYRDGVTVSGEVPGVHIKQLSGGDRKPRWLQDEVVLRRYLEAHPDDHRALFYLGQTLELLGKHEPAAETYERRSKLGGWEEEVYESLYRRARCLEALVDNPESGYVWADAQQAYLEAHAARTTRAEPLHRIAQHWLGRSNALCLLFARDAQGLPIPSDTVPTVEEDVYRWKIDDLIGTAAYYTRFRHMGPSACERAMKNAPAGHALRIHRNYSFYTRSAKDLFGGFESVSLQIPLPEPYVGVNPSIWIGMVNGVLRRFCILRGVNFEPTPDGNNYIVRDADQIVRTRNYWLELDENYELVDDALEIVDRSGRRTSNFPVHGYEDMRLFRWRGKFWATATVCDAGDRGDSRATGSRCEIGLLGLDGGFHLGVASCQLLRGPWSDHFQKNWRPLADADAGGGIPQFVYSSEPLCVLVYVDGGLVVRGEAPVPAPPPAHGLRGSSQVIWVEYAIGDDDDYRPMRGWLWVDHEVSFDARGGGRMYQERFVFSEGPDLQRVTHTSDPFHLHEERGIEFVCGLAQDGDRLVLSYGERDLRAKLGFVSLETVLRSLNPA